MKKFYAFLAAALLSVSVFAAKDVVPSDATIMAAAGAEAGQVVVCIYIPGAMACFDVVFVGTYHQNETGGWATDVANLAKFEPIEGYDGWYVVAVDDETESPEGKPVMLDVDGNFNWAYQVGAATAIRGGVSVVQGQYEGEIDLKTYGKDAPNVYTVDAWKQNPCTAIYHNYTVEVISTGCDNLAVPFIIGGMNNWGTPQELQINMAKTQELQVPVYYITFKAAEETEYQLLSGLRDPNTGAIDSTAKPGWYDAAYLQILVDGVWQRYNPNNSKLGAEANVVYDLRVDTLQWARCDNQPEEYTVVTLKAPVGAPAKVEIIGTFGEGWEVGTEMELLSTGSWLAEVHAKAGQVFKFRSGVGETADDKWANEILYYDAENDAWKTFGDGNKELVFGQLWEDDTNWDEVPCKWISLDFSDPDSYKWKMGDEEAIENVVLTEKARKVVVDGVIYIVRDNKLFNLQGAQVR